MTKSTSLFWSADMRAPVPPGKRTGYIQVNNELKEDTWMLYKSKCLTLVIVGKPEKGARKVLANCRPTKI